MLKLNNLQKLVKSRKRVGRGGKKGATSGRGRKGQKARSGGRSEIKPFFEGGQMPLSRRLPCRGFTNPLKSEVKIISLRDLEAHFSAGDEVTRTTLKEKKLIKGNRDFFVKVLGQGDLTKNLTVIADAFSSSAKQAIEKAGGRVKLMKEIVSGSAAA